MDGCARCTGAGSASGQAHARVSWWGAEDSRSRPCTATLNSSAAVRNGPDSPVGACPAGPCSQHVLLLRCGVEGFPSSAAFAICDCLCGRPRGPLPSALALGSVLACGTDHTGLTRRCQPAFKCNVYENQSEPCILLHIYFFYRASCSTPGFSSSRAAWRRTSAMLLRDALRPAQPLPPPHTPVSWAS